MQKRREFLKQSGTIALGGLLLHKQSKAFIKKSATQPLGVQLFTFFNVIDNDVKGTLKKVADCYYRRSNAGICCRSKG